MVIVLIGTLKFLPRRMQDREFTATEKSVGTKSEDPMQTYDPNATPHPETWLALNEMERVLLVEKRHKCARTKLPNARLHASLHVVVENQIAEGSVPEVDEAMERLMSQGLDRHESLHAIANEVAAMFFHLTHGETTEDPMSEYCRNVATLTVESWRNTGDAE
jgi:hypothetical protein